MNADGTVTLVEGSTDIGGTRTSIAMQLAETLGIAAEDVSPHVADTDSVGYTDVTGGSRVDVRHRPGRLRSWASTSSEQMVERAADALGMRPGERRVRRRRLSASNGKSLTFKRAGRQAEPRPAGRSSAAPRSIPKGSTNGFGTHIVDVEVDPETGKVDDPALHGRSKTPARRSIPAMSKARCKAGAVQGIGWALNEEYFFDDEGRMQNASLSRLPHAHVRSTCR